MNTQGFTAGRASLNVTLNKGHDIVKAITAAGLDQGKTVVLFANETGGGSNLMCPETATQNNGSAPWVDKTQDLTTLGADPAKDLLYLQVWVEATQNYYAVGGIVRDLSNGMTIQQALS
jgi:hypothetical protein